MKMNLVIYLVGEYETFHRRTMIRALARALDGQGKVLCVEPWVRGLGGDHDLRHLEPSLSVYRPHVLPHESALHKIGAWKAHWQANAKRLRAAIRETFGSDGDIVAWMYKPDQLWLRGMAQEKHLVYECYDEYRLNMSGKRLDDVREKEHELLRAADQVFVTSERLLAGRSELNPSIKVVPNGVDFELFSSRAAKVPEELAKLPRPRIGHIGNLMECLDLDLLRGLIESRPEWSFVHIGPVSVGADADHLKSLPNFHMLGVKPQAELPAYLAGLDVALMLFKQNRFTEAVDPLKLYEYLAARVPVVSTRFAALGQAEDAVWLARDASDFLDCIEEALTHDSPQRKLTGLAVAKSRDWSELARQALESLVTLNEPEEAAA